MKRETEWEKNRKRELLDYLTGKIEQGLVENYVDEVVALEKALLTLRDEPPVLTHPKKKTLKKPNPVYKQKIALLAQYNSCMRTLVHLAGGADGAEEESPLRKWLNDKNMDTGQ